MHPLFNKSTTMLSSPARRCFLLLVMLVWTMNALFSQTTWDGSASTDWNTAANWSTNVLPGAADDVIIPGAMPNQPTLSTAGVLAKSITVASGGTLTITSSGTLTINGATTQGLLNQGTVQNSGTLNIGSTASNGDEGISNSGTFNNNMGGQIRIDRSINTALYNAGGTFTNLAAITIGATANIGLYGIVNIGAIFNNNSGQIDIDRAGSRGIYNSNGSFTNQATITLGATAIGAGLRNEGVIGIFTNSPGGQINIHRAGAGGTSGIYNTGAGTFTNQANIDIGITASVSDFGIENQATFNNTGGQITINRSTRAGIRSTSNFSNAGTITLGNLAPMNTLIEVTSGTFTNNNGGILKGTGSIFPNQFTNAGGTLSPGYSPGKMTFDAGMNFSNSTVAIEVNGTGVAGTNYDQVVVNGTATLGGTLALSINYVPTAGDQMTILTATARSGNFGSVTGLPAGWIINYTPIGVILSFGALPVELSDFTARLLEQSVQLDWRTASENNNKGFYAERSHDGLRWMDLGFVAGSGTTTEAQGYAFLDEEPLPGTNYYRLRQTDFHGKEQVSKVISVDRLNTGTVRVFPNPVSNGELHLLLPDHTEEEITVHLFNAAGQLLRSATLHTGSESIDVSSLTAGMYTLQIRSGNGNSFEKIVVGKN